MSFVDAISAILGFISTEIDEKAQNQACFFICKLLLIRLITIFF